MTGPDGVALQRHSQRLGRHDGGLHVIHLGGVAAAAHCLTEPAAATEPCQLSYWYFWPVQYVKILIAPQKMGSQRNNGDQYFRFRTY